jgi:hypothetical protein
MKRGPPTLERRKLVLPMQQRSGVPEASRYQILQTARTGRQDFVADLAPLGRGSVNHDKFACKECFEHKPAGARHFILISRVSPRLSRAANRSLRRQQPKRSTRRRRTDADRPQRHTAEHLWRYFANDFFRSRTPRHVPLLYHFLEHLPVPERIHRTPEPFVPIGDEVS